jgi:hypothetical protein
MADRKAWLWSDDRGQAFLSTGRRLYGPGQLPDRNAVLALRRNASIHAVLPAELAKAFAAPVWDTLVLDNSLAEIWHRLEWEALHVNGQPLSEVCSVVRLAKISKSQQTPPRGALLVVTQLAKDDPIRLAVSQLLKSEEIGAFSHWGTPQAPDRINCEWRADHDLAASFSDLLLFAHGGENDQLLVLDAEGNSWLDASKDLPRLPPRVWLFVCSDLNGNLTPLVQRLLAHGACQVLYGHGKLEAKKMVDVFASWLAADSDALTCDLIGPIGKSTLRLAGEVSMLDPDQLTLQQDMNTGWDPLKGLKTSPLDLSRQARQLGDFGSSVNQCWPRTQNWLLPYLSYLAEYSQDQVSRVRYERQWQSLDDDVKQISPATAYFLAAAAHRDGLYVHQARYLNQVLELCGNNVDVHDIVFKVLLSMANLLIDMNLPHQNAVLLARLDSLLETIQSRDSQTQKFELLDVKARQALREGNADVALHHYITRIRLESLETTWNGLNSARAYATALFAGAWTRHAMADHWAAKCIEILPSIPVGHHPYLCRSLALYCWRCPDGAHSDRARRDCSSWLESVLATDRHLDIGPVAVTTAVLLLCPIDSVQRDQLVRAWETRLRLGMQDQRYWFELASWSCLLGKPAEALAALERFHAQRQAILDELTTLPHLQDALDCAPLAPECVVRKELELTLLGAPNADVENWLQNGCLPL